MSLAPGGYRISASVGRGGVNQQSDVLFVQQLINQKLPIPLRPLTVDGRCGPMTIGAIEEIQRRNLHMNPPDGRVDPSGATFRFRAGTVGGAPPATGSAPPTTKIAWGAKVSAAFKAKVIKISGNLGVDPNYLMAAMAFESGETFSASVKNAASGATGLIQFMPSTATSLGTSTSALAAMTPENQLDYVEKYFTPYKNKLNSLENVYMAILWPAAIGKPNNYVLFSSPSVAYQQNKGLDADKDGNVTKAEASAKVRAELMKGQGPGFIG
jgi:hypothetical protein